MALLFENMRPLDRMEVEAASGPDVLATLYDSWELTPNPESAWADGKLLAVRGIVPGGRMGCIWMLGTNELGRYRGAHTRLARRYIETALEVYDVLYNYVHIKNEPSIRWLDRLGFTFGEPQPVGRAKELFIRFEKSRV